ncbi:hypothetical protein BC936DRAFT_140807 [Jimgerdemannia flammicorona]|uniref:Uncharacterized protein n=1 Tax=Jimgerdemannia flammicorona TaxID=994334 RepID=A0A433DGP6_9FUNG|nr:hypothetical protein BC936DRAFT_140807 [Jimgerdemannia flammicorona]
MRADRSPSTNGDSKSHHHRVSPRLSITKDTADFGRHPSIPTISALSISRPNNVLYSQSMPVPMPPPLAHAPLTLSSSSFTSSSLPSSLPWNEEKEGVPIYEVLIPPDNFNMVSKHIYRSSFPKKKNFAFLKKLGLKSML